MGFPIEFRTFEKCVCACVRVYHCIPMFVCLLKQFASMESAPLNNFPSSSNTLLVLVQWSSFCLRHSLFHDCDMHNLS